MTGAILFVVCIALLPLYVKWACDLLEWVERRRRRKLRAVAAEMKGNADTAPNVMLMTRLEIGVRLTIWKRRISAGRDNNRPADGRNAASSAEYEGYAMNDTKVKVTLAFEVPYSDDSGSEFAVRYRSSDRYKPDGTIEFETVGDPTQFPADRIDWLIQCLSEIKAEMSKQRISEEKAATVPSAGT